MSNIMSKGHDMDIKYVPSCGHQHGLDISLLFAEHSIWHHVDDSQRLSINMHAILGAQHYARIMHVHTHVHTCEHQRCLHVGTCVSMCICVHWSMSMITPC